MTIFAPTRSHRSMIARILSLFRRDPFGLNASLRQRKQLRVAGFARHYRRRG